VSPDPTTPSGRSTGASVNGSSPDAIEADIERQREELAATVSALQDRLDVKSRAKEKAAELKDRATTDTGKPRPELAALAVAAVVGVVGLVVWRRRR
jgi:cobalamin biosynthesis Mg chelatase CobN